MKKLPAIFLFLNCQRRKMLPFFFFLLASTLVTGQQIKLNIDHANSEIRSKRVRLGLEVNKGVTFSGVVKIFFGTDSNTLTTHVVGNVLDSEEYNLKTYYFEKESLSPNTTYVYKWSLETGGLGSFETELQQITTPSGFDVLPYQLFEIPEEGIIPGDTIGFLRYEDTDGSWKKIKTYYKTTLGLKSDGTLWAWGRNAKRLVVNPASQSEVIYEPIQINLPPDPGNIDRDGDGFWNVDEEEYGNSDPDDSNSTPQNSDGDFLSDAFEIFLGMDPNNGDITWEEDQKLFAFFLEEFSDPDNSLKFHDFTLSRTSVLAIEKDTRHLWFWGVGMGNTNLDLREYDLDQSHPNPDDPNGGFYFPNGYTRDQNDNSLPPFNFAIADMSTGYESIFEFPYVIDSLKTWDKVAMSNNYSSPKFKNLNNLGEIYDTTVAGITTDGDLYIWGIVEGLLLPNYIQVGTDRKWRDVKVGDAIIALATDGTIHEIGMDVPQNANNSTLDKDNDGVPDVDDAFEWDPNFQYDSDDDGFPDKAEDQRGTDKNNPDTDGDGVNDAEDQLPLDPRYSKDNDFDGLADELDPNDDNWDSDGDGAADGWDADPMDPTKKWDCDGDGLSDEEEWEQWSDPCILDTDGDGVDDKDDKFPRTYYYQYDTDGDGLPDALELLNETDPNKSDTDEDGYLDAIAADKFNYFRELANNLDCSQGWDRCDQWQYFWRFWDIKYDCDGNGWVSWEEWEGISPACQNLQPRDDFPTDPNANMDTDRDGDPDNTDPDDDNDGFEDVVETNENVNTDPKDWESQPLDSDGDRLPDGIEKEQNTDPFNWDSDFDGAGDGWDAWPLDPKISWDDDKDKVENWIEMQFLNTDPNNPDTDGDGVDDFLDAFPTDPNSIKDSDGDGLSDSYEDANGLNKNSKDSDGDGYFDAPCNRDKMVLFTDDYGNSWYEPNWRECEGEWKQVDTDGDGVYNDDDDDDDGDGIPDIADNDWYNTWEFTPSTWKEDKFPTISSEYVDFDEDGIGDNADTDDDNDGYADTNDDFPNDPTEWLNTDKPTVANGGLADWDNDGIYGEDYGNDGWIDEINDHRKYDFIGNNKDPDDDGDLFLDVDEIFNGTDPLDKNDYPGGGTGDSDFDGLSDKYEIEVNNSDPFDWDSDDDGVSDGWKFPDHKVQNWSWFDGATWRDYFFRERDEQNFSEHRWSNYFFSNESYTNWSDSAWIGHGHWTPVEFASMLFDKFPNDPNEFWDTDGDGIGDHSDPDGDNDGIPNDQDIYPFKSDLSQDIDFDRIADTKDEDIDGDGWLNFDEVANGTDPNDSNSTPTVDSDGDGLSDFYESNSVPATSPNNWDTDGDGVSDGYKYPPHSENYIHQDGDTWRESFFRTRDLTSNKNNYYAERYSPSRGPEWHEYFPYFIDAFPTDNSEYWDTDGDGIGDNSDTDIDGDLISNQNDALPYDNRGSNDVDNDLIPDALDENADNDTYLNFDETHIGSNPLVQEWNFNTSDPDGDGFSSAYEQSSERNTDPNDWDTDNDGVSDGWQYPNAKQWRQWQDGDTWQDHFFVERYADGSNGTSFYWFNYGRTAGTGEGSLFIDQFPNDASEYWDTDGDGTPDNTDTDDDNDGLTDAYETKVKRNGWNWTTSDPFRKDTDGDGIEDGVDAIPWYDRESVDTDGDFQGNNEDFDDDGDGLWDNEEKELGLDPLNPDSDGDGWYDGDCIPGAVLYDALGNWQHSITFTGSSTLVNEKYLLRFWFDQTASEREIVYKTTATLAPSELVIELANLINLPENDFTDEGDPITATTSGSTLVLTGEREWRRHHLNTWELERNRLRGRPNWCDWVNRDKFPHNKDEWQDLDGDDIGDNEDTDDDNDGLSDVKEHALGTNPYYWDSDGDWRGDDWDKLPLDPTAFEDTDGDGIPDFTIVDSNGDGFLDPDIWGGPDVTTEVDQDLDGDGLLNTYENNNGTDMYQPDSDWDGYLDGEDVFPTWHEEWYDTDQDGIGNNKDQDDDNDKYSDKDELFNGTDPLDASSFPTDDLDQDFLSDLYEEEMGTLSTNKDTDEDGYVDGLDAFPTDKTEWLDSDNDGEGNNRDWNDDDDKMGDYFETIAQEKLGWSFDPLIFDDWNEFPYDDDWDGLPDDLENYLSNYAKNIYDSSNDERKREIYRAVKGIRNWSDDDNDSIRNQDDIDADGNGTDDHLEPINFFDYDDDGVLNINEQDSDDDGAEDGWDQAFMDRRGVDDFDFDLIHDWDDFDRDNDLILNNWERLYGTDQFNEDTDGDGVTDTYDFQGYEPKIQNRNQFTASLFDLNQIGTSSNWEYLDTWNYGQSGASYAAINSGGELYVWGVNYGALPINDDKSLQLWENGENYGFVIPTPTRVRPREKWKKISLGYKFGVGYSTDGTFYSWGRNLSSQLGKGKPTTYEKFSMPSITLGEITELSAGEQQVGIINKDGKLRMIGSNDQGQLGTGATNDNVPKELDWEEIDGTIKEVKVTETETQILTTSNQIWAYGDNLFAQLGRGTRDTKAENYEAKKISEEGWVEVFAISEHVYAFQSDGTLWAWGKNKNFDLGLGFKSEYVAVPTKVEGVSKNDIKDFSPLRGGFVFIKNNGELWGAGANFYTGSWFPLSTPRKIGNDSDWSHFHDFIGSELNILIEKDNGSIWGAGTNWSRVLTENPCPDPQNQINKITLTHPNQYQTKEFEFGEITGSATYTIKINGVNLSTSNVTNTTDLINNISNLFAQNETLINNFSLTATPTNTGSSTLRFTSKLYKENSFSFSLVGKSNDFEGAVKIKKLKENISGTATFTVSLNGTRVSASADNLTDALANLKNEFETSQAVSEQMRNYTITTSGTSLLFENINRQSFFTSVEVLNSPYSIATIETSTTQSRIEVNCWPRYLNNLVEIFPAGNSWDKIALGVKHAIGLDDNGKLYSWGQNDQLQLGLGSNKWEPKNQPTQITSTGTKTFIDIDASAEVSFAIDSDKKMYAWGDNDLGTLAVGDYSDKGYPTPVKGDISWKTNLGGYRFQVALDENNKPYGWGYRKFGQLGALGKVKGDDIIWDTDLNESQGAVQTLNEGEYLVATQEFINYLETLFNFEYNSNSGKNATAKGSIQKASEFSSQTMKFENTIPNTRKNVGKWKVKKSKPAFKGKSAIGENQNLMTQQTPYNFTVVDVNEKPSDIILTDLAGKITQKVEQFISSITVTDPDQDDILTVTIPTNSPNKNKFSIKNQKLYFNSSTSKAKVPYQVIIRATDWEGLSLEKQFEVLVDEEGNIAIEEQEIPSSGGSSGIYFDERFMDSDGDGFVDADEFLIGTDPFDFRSFPSDIDKDGILDFYDGDIDNDGYLNEDDQFPSNPAEWIDADQDGIGDNLDTDDDNDGIPDIDVNWAENYVIQDLFPNDPNESTDFDRDGIGDNSDPDDDNDGYADTIDSFPYNPYEWLDSDNDSIGDNEDLDNDNDGFSDFDENAIGTNPLDPNDFPSDLDGDFVPDVIDFDRDGDGINNDFDNAPDLYNPTQEFIDDENHIKLVFQEFFSPNGDGINDNFEIGEIQRYPNNKVWVYDSAGNMVFYAEEYKNNWQGAANGNPLPKGSYLYRVDADGNGTTEYHGWIYLTR